MWKTLPVWWFLFCCCCKLCPVVTKQRKWKTYTVPSIPGGPSCQSPYPPCTFCPLSIRVIVLIWRLQPDTRRFHTWLVRVTVPLQQGSGGWQKHGGCLEVVFLPSPFKSTLQRAPLWPLMHPVHLAKQSCETQDHRHGQKQFHPLSEPISTSRFEDKQESDMFYCICLTYKLCILPSVIVMWLPTLVTCPSISVCLLFCQIPHILPLMGTKYTNLLVWEKTNIFLFSLLFPSRHCLRVRVAWAQRDEAASVWNQIQSWVMGKWWRGVLDALAQANGLAGSERLTVHYVRLRLDSIEGKLLLTALMSNKPLNSHIIVWYWWLWYFNWA